MKNILSSVVLILLIVGGISELNAAKEIRQKRSAAKILPGMTAN